MQDVERAAGEVASKEGKQRAGDALAITATDALHRIDKFSPNLSSLSLCAFQSRHLILKLLQPPSRSLLSLYLVCNILESFFILQYSHKWPTRYACSCGKPRYQHVIDQRSSSDCGFTR